tara:strand:+ start:349 stop:576 length:228 start_codon:yes stop_codon:yes gene_type:complete
MASPSQNVEDDADDAKAVEVKLIIGLSTIWTAISSEKEEQPIASNVSTFIRFPVISVLVERVLDPDFTPRGLLSK